MQKGFVFFISVYFVLFRVVLCLCFSFFILFFLVVFVVVCFFTFLGGLGYY